MIKGFVRVGTAAALAAAAAMLSPTGVYQAQAAGPKFFAKPFHHRHHHAFKHRRFDGMLAGYALGSYDGPVTEVSLPVEITGSIPAPAGLTCTHSRQTVTVSSESGGTREITITRC